MSLFDGVVEAAAMSAPYVPNHRERVGLQKLGNPANFRFYKYEVVGGEDSRDCLMTGCVVTRTYTKGAKKGQPMYDGPPSRVVVTEDEHLAERRRYETETGNCANCTGSSQEWCGWDHVTGHKYRECRACSGSGRAGA